MSDSAILKLDSYHPVDEWRNLLRLKPSHKNEIVFGFLLRLLVAVVSVVVPVALLLIVGFFNGWRMTTPLLSLFAAFVSFTIFFGEHLRSRIYERSVPAEVNEGANVIAPPIEEILWTARTGSRKFWLLKPIADSVIAILSMFLLPPLICVIVVAIKFESSGPLLCRSEHRGFARRKFYSFKFRTKIEDQGVIRFEDAFALKRDPRETAVGSVLRKTRLESLPLLFNVAVGDMSLVGPKLLPLELDVKLSELSPGLDAARHCMRPGLFSLAEASEGPISINRQIACDAFYVRNWSIGMDLKILIVSLTAMLAGVSAY